VLTKLDGDAKGGAALSVAGVTGRPILFASSGEKQSEFDVFYPDRMARRILDLGDILTLIEQAQKAFDEEQTKEMEEKFRSETFTLDDFLGQLQQIKKMGSLSGMLSMLPGARGMQDQIDNIDENELVRTEAIIQSMTPRERLTPKVLNGSRRLRIAGGSGTTVTEVNQLVIRFDQAAKMMKTVAKGGVPQIPGMGPVARGGGSSKKNQRRNRAPGRGTRNARQRGARCTVHPRRAGRKLRFGQEIGKIAGGCPLVTMGTKNLTE